MEQVTGRSPEVYMVILRPYLLLLSVIGVVLQLTIETVDPCAMRLQGYGPIKMEMSSALGLKLLPEM